MNNVSILLLTCCIILLNGCTNPNESLHGLTSQLGLTKNNDYVPQAQINFALPNNWQTDVVRFKSVGVKQAPAPKGQYSDTPQDNSNNPILNNGLNNNNNQK